MSDLDSKGASPSFDLENIRSQFPFLEKEIIYFDNAATTQKAQWFGDAWTSAAFYTNANVHRGVYRLAQEATCKFESVRKKIGKWLQVDAERFDVLFSSGTTSFLNMWARSVEGTLEKGDHVLASVLDHHSAFLPWQQLAVRKDLVLDYCPMDPVNFCISETKFRDLLKKKPRIVLLTAVSNVTGAVHPVKDLAVMAKKAGAKVIVDAAQWVGHHPVDFSEIADFVDALVFSTHKVYGPTGLGVCVANKKFLEELSPSSFGGEMVSEVGEKESTWNVSPWKFEAGTPPFLEVLAFESVIDFFETKLDLKQAEEWESQLKEYFLTQLNKRQNIQIFHPPRGESSGIVSFLHRNIHPQDLMSFLDRNGFCLRVGHHCAQPLHKNLNIEGSMRVSFAFYNTISEIDQFFEAFDEAIDFFSGREKGQSSLGFTEKDILKAIAVVEDPELMVPLVDLGLVYGVSIDEGRNVHVDMTLTSPGCPLAQQIVLNVEDSVRSLSGFEDVKVNLVWEPKWDPKKMASEEAKEILGIW